MIAFFTRPINWLNILNRRLFTDQYLHLFSPGNLTQNLTRWLRQFKLQKRAHFKNGGRRSVLDDLSCVDFRTNLVTDFC